jgi:hypothetical protein
MKLDAYRCHRVARSNRRVADDGGVAMRPVRESVLNGEAPGAIGASAQCSVHRLADLVDHAMCAA